MNQYPHETALETARRNVHEGEQRIARLNQLMSDMRTLGKPVDHLEHLLAEYQEWLAVARRHLERQESAAVARDGQN